MNTEEIKKEVVKDEIIHDKPKRGRKPKEKASEPQFTEADLQEFKQWKAERSNKEKSSSSIVLEEGSEDKIRQKWKEESRLVKGIFRCHEPVGGQIMFPFRKYKWDQTKWYTLVDGETYEIPLAVARHLNENCSYAVHSHIMDAQGKPTVDRSGKKISRMSFESLEFTSG